MVRSVFGVVLCLAPVSAFAWESDVEGVEFASQTELYKGTEYSVALPEGSSPVKVVFTVDTFAYLDLYLTADSWLEGPDALVQSFDGRDGIQQLVTETELSATVNVDLWGYVFSAPLWADAFTWTGTEEFYGLLLSGGSPVSSTVEIDPTALLELGYVYETEVEGVPLSVTLAGEVAPNSTVTLTGNRVVANEVEATEAGQEVELPFPAENRGTYEVTSRWEGSAAGTLGLDLVPSVTVCAYETFCYPLEFVYTWNFADTQATVIADAKDFQHAMPALKVDDDPIDFGDVTVGESKTLEIEVENQGDIALSVDVDIDGEGFSVDDDSLVVTIDNDGVVSVTFEPQDEGAVTGELVLLTDDPLEREVVIALTANGEPEVVDDTVDPADDSDDPATDDQDPGVDDGSGTEIGDGDLKGCGCTSVPTGATAYVGLLGGLLATIRRRRR